MTDNTELGMDLATYGVSFQKDGKRIDPKDVYADNTELKPEDIDHVAMRLAQIASGDWRMCDDSAEAIAADALCRLRGRSDIKIKEELLPEATPSQQPLNDAELVQEALGDEINQAFDDFIDVDVSLSDFAYKAAEVAMQALKPHLGGGWLPIDEGAKNGKQVILAAFEGKELIGCCPDFWHKSNGQDFESYWNDWRDCYAEIEPTHYQLPQPPSEVS